MEDKDALFCYLNQNTRRRQSLHGSSRNLIDKTKFNCKKEEINNVFGMHKAIK